MLWRCPVLPDGFLLVEREVFERLESFRQRCSTAAEAGGILLGYRRGPHLHVVDATTPGPQDVRMRYGFHRRDSSHEQIALARWKRSRHTLDYVGEWHTHPQVHPVPSSLDLTEWTQILGQRAESMVFAVLGLTDCWVGVGLRRRIARAVPMPGDARSSALETMPLRNTYGR